MIDICFVVAPQNCGWVLDRIAKEIGKRVEGEVFCCYSIDKLPPAKHYFVTHYSLVPAVLAVANPSSSKVDILFTHESIPLASYIPYLKQCHAVICENAVELARLLSHGVSVERLEFVVECGDNKLFTPHSRTGDGAVLISSACYARKSPTKIVEVMRSLPNRKFIVIGKGWGEDFFPSNAVYHDNLPYDKYPEYYSKCDVFLSCASLEGGGPGGLIESMHSNLIPVVSDTGNAKEYILHGYNGLIFPVKETADNIAKLVETAYSMKPQESLPYNDVWQTIQHYTWDYYADQMKEIIFDTQPDYGKVEVNLI